MNNIIRANLLGLISVCLVFCLSGCGGFTPTPGLPSTGIRKPSTITTLTIVQSTLRFSPTNKNFPLPTFTATILPETRVPTILPTQPTLLPPVVSPTLERILTEALNPGALGVYIFNRDCCYGFWTFQGEVFGRPPGLYMEFAHFADRVAYWSQGVKVAGLWLSDLAMESPTELFTNTQALYPDYDVAHYPYELIDLDWSADDQHLMVDVEENKELNLIYHVQTGTLEPWPYTCNQLALSPRSGRLATWCSPNDGEKGYAIVEWGGEIWYSQAEPEHELAQEGEDRVQFWGWSSDGEQIAYFDPADPQGHLYIADAQGKVRLKLFTGGAYWLGVEAGSNLGFLTPPSPPIQWSYDSSRLVVYAFGDQDHLCPVLQSESGKIFQEPCWQVIDASSGEVIWTVMEWLRESAPPWALTSMDPYYISFPAISPDGQYLAIGDFIYADGRGVDIVDLNTHKITPLFENYVDNMRWGPAP
jgi:hypothetical protein